MAGSKVDAARIRETQVLELRVQGHPFARIAAAVGYSNASAAKKAFDRALARENELTAADREEQRKLMRARLDSLLAACWQDARSNPGGKAMSAAIRLLERQAKLDGLDAPTNIKISDGMDAEIEQLLEQLGVQPGVPTGG